MSYDHRDYAHIRNNGIVRTDERTMLVTLALGPIGDDWVPFEDQEEPAVMEIPFVWAVCGTCDGKGRHVNPNIDRQGLTREDFDEDPDFAEDYFNGFYDQPCNQCGGSRVEPELKPVTDAEKAHVEAWHKSIEDDYQYERMCAAERAMGA